MAWDSSRFFFNLIYFKIYKLSYSVFLFLKYLILQETVHKDYLWGGEIGSYACVCVRVCKCAWGFGGRRKQAAVEGK